MALIPREICMSSGEHGVFRPKRAGWALAGQAPGESGRIPLPRGPWDSSERRASRDDQRIVAMGICCDLPWSAIRREGALLARKHDYASWSA